MNTITSNPVFLYLEINEICFALLAILLTKTISGLDRRRPTRLFCFISSCYLFAFASDSVWMLAKTGILRSTQLVMNISLIIYFNLLAIGSFLWFLYIENAQDGKVTKSRLFELLCSIPLMFLLALVDTSPLTGIIFKITENKEYIRGDYYFLLVLCIVLYPVFSSIKSFVKGFTKKYYYHRKLYFMLGGLIVIPCVFSIIQYFVGIDYPVLVVGYTGAVLAIYIETQEAKITVDKLTGLNTRDEVLKVVSHGLALKDGEKHQYLFMIDADEFKGINDRYGHLEGDNALIIIAEALKRGMPKDFVIGRYGGDEFIAIGAAYNNAQAMGICSDIDNALNKLSEEKPYKLSVSIGFAKRRKETNSVPDFIKLADDKLYVIKESKQSDLKFKTKENNSL